MTFKANILLFSVVFLVSACGRQMLYDTAIFESYVETFEKESITYGMPTQVLELVIRFSTELKNDVAGQCQRNPNASPLILINISYWEYLTPGQKEILLFHEMGHCVLGFGHDDTEKAIMNTRLLAGYGSNREGLLRNFFKKPLTVIAHRVIVN